MCITKDKPFLLILQKIETYMQRKDEKLKQFERLLSIMETLRANCSWNKSQTFESLRTMTIEETYELSDAILKNKTEEIKKELGDLIFHTIFYSSIAEEENIFDISDVLKAASDKMEFRHPHVFSNDTTITGEDISDNWEKIKLKEKGRPQSILAGVADSLPPIIKAAAMQDKARGIGFDWKNREDVWEKLKEEQDEFEEEIKAMPDTLEAKQRAEEELGDFLFSTINVSRLYGINADTALNKACDKFKRRFTYIEDRAKEMGKSIDKLSIEEMEEFWQESKKKQL